MRDLEKDKILLLAHSIGKMARELQSIKGLLKEIVDTPQTETQTETQNSNLPFEKCEYCEYRYARYVGVCDMCELIGDEQNSSEKPNNCKPKTEK